MPLETPKSELMIVPTEPSLISGLPVDLAPGIQAIIDAFDDGPDGDIARLRTLMTMDASYQEHDPRLPEVRRQQAEGLQEHIERTGNVIRYNEFFLGFLLIFANQHQLHTYLGYPDLTSWCYAMNIRDTVLIQKAMELAGAHSFLHDLGYSVQDVVDGSITPGIKTNMIKGLARKAPDELIAHQVTVLRERYPEIVDQAQLETALTKNKRAVVQGAINALSDEQQGLVRREVERRYIEQARQRVEQIRASGEGDLILTQQIKHGEPQRPLIHLTIEWRNGACFFSANSFPCGPSEVAAMLKNQYDLRLHVPDKEGSLTVKQYGDYLSEFVTPDDYLPYEEEEDTIY